MDSACVSSVCYAGGYLDERFRAAAAAAATRSVGLLPTECSRSCQLRSYYRTLHERMERGHGVGPEHQVTKEPQRVERSVAISLMAYLMLLKFRAPISQRRVPGVCLPSNATSHGRPPSNACAKASRSVKLHDQTGVPVVFKKLSIRLDQSVNRLDAIDTTQPCFPRTLWHTARIASTIANLLVLTHHVHIRPQLADALRSERPLYPRHLSLRFAVSSGRHPSLQFESH
jgi:hypothetical protein